MSLLNLQRKIAKLESGGAAPPSSLGPGWWDDFEGFDLLHDPSWRPWCTLDQFLVGRAATVACWWRLMDSYAFWSEKHREPDWWDSPVWRGKTPDWQEQIDRARRLYCPPKNRTSMAAFCQWLYSDAPRYEGDRPWEWCQRGICEFYSWPGYGHWQDGSLPMLHALAIASACWLIDDLGLKPRQVQENALEHRCAFKWRDLSCLRQVHLPDRPITGTSPKLRIAEMTTWAQAHNIPIDEERSRQSDGLELLELLMCVASGCGGPHGRELWFPALGAG